MRKLALLGCCLCACDPGDLQPEFFDDAATHRRAQCVSIEALNARGSQVSDVVAATDSTILVLYGSERELVTYDAQLRPVAVLRFDPAGPRGVGQAVSAATDGRLYYVADERYLAVKIFDARGEDRGTIRLDFIPRRIRAVGGSIAITPLVAGSYPATLLYELRHGRLVSRPIPTVHYQDGGLNAFANMGSLATFANGRVVVMHETVVPFGYSLSFADATSLTRRFAVPLPALQRPRMNKLPPTPLTEKSLGDVLTVALTATANPRTGHVYFLTRSGRKLGDAWEKMIVELDDQLRYSRSARVGGIRALHMSYAAARNSLLVVDDADGWFECKL